MARRAEEQKNLQAALTMARHFFQVAQDKILEAMSDARESEPAACKAPAPSLHRLGRELSLRPSHEVPADPSGKLAGHTGAQLEPDFNSDRHRCKTAHQQVASPQVSAGRFREGARDDARS